MFRRNIVLVLLAGLLFLGARVGVVSAADAAPKSNNGCAWTNLHFAEFLAGKYGIKVADGLSQEDKYKALVNALSKKGIKSFADAKSSDKVSCCGAADALYTVAGVKEPAGTCDLKIGALIKSGVLKVPAGGDPCGALCNIEDAFGPVAEKFHAPFNPPNTNPPGETPENPSSRI